MKKEQTLTSLSGKPRYAALKTPEALGSFSRFIPPVVALGSNERPHFHSAMAGGFVFLVSNSLFIQEHALILLPSLAKAVGLNEAVVLQQLHFLLRNPANGKTLGDGEHYIFNTYEEWRTVFPFWSAPTIKRIFAELEDRGLVVSKQPEGNASRRKYYRIGSDAYGKLTFDMLVDRTISSDERIKLIPSTDQVDRLNGSNPSLPLIAETTTETTHLDLKMDRPDGISESIYQAYPRKVAKAAAIKAIEKALRATTAELLLAATHSYATAVSAWPEDAKKFVPYPATWFNRGSYEDDQNNWKRDGHSRTQTPNPRLTANSHVEQYAGFNSNDRIA